jgi:hypothetical protein
MSPTITTKKRRTTLWVSLGLAPFIIFFGLIFVFPLANLASGIASLILEREPTDGEFVGDYKYSAPWGTATLDLNSDGTFTEAITEKANPPKRFAGSWTSRKDDNSAMVDFRPFGMVWDENHGAETNIFGMNFYKRRFGNTYAKINDDLGEQFERQ